MPARRAFGFYLPGFEPAIEGLATYAQTTAERRRGYHASFSGFVHVKTSFTTLYFTQLVTGFNGFQLLRHEMQLLCFVSVVLNRFSPAVVRFAAMKWEEEDFYAPQPKLSWQMQFIRGCALLTATCISIGFLMIELIPLVHSQSLDLSNFIVTLILTPFHIVLLIPCWRCWLLHRWACVVTFTLLLMGTLLILPVGLIFTLPIILMLSVIQEELPNLKKGF